MTLLAPFLLLGLLGLSLPLLAHLLGREPPRRIRFAAVRFLPRTDPAVTHRRALQDLPLLLVRLLLLALLILAIARPASPRGEELAVVGVPHDALILVDSSYSMELRDASGPASLAAARRAADIVEALPTGSRVGLLTSDPRGPRVSLTDARPPVLGALEEWSEPGARAPGAWKLADALPEAVAMLSDGAAGDRTRVIYAVSDASARGLGSLPESTADAVLLVPVPARDDPGDPAHVGIVEATWQPAPEIDPRAVRILVSIRRHGDAASIPGPVPLQLLVEDREVARAEVDFDAGDLVPIEFTHTLLSSSGPTRATLRLDLTSDPLPRDDTRHLWLSADESLDVTVVNGDPSELRAHDETFFLTTALAATADSMRVEVRMMAPEQLAEALAAEDRALDSTDVLVLANVPAPAEVVTPGIIEAVDAGMGLFIAVGDRVRAGDYNLRLGKLLPLLLREAVLVGTLPGRAEARKVGLAPPDLSHPALAGLQGDMGLTGTRARKVFLLEPDATRNSRAAISFTSGAPALVTRSHGQGRVGLLTTSLDRDWSDLPLRPGFVPLVQKVLAWLGDAAVAAGPDGAQLMVGDPREMRSTGAVTVTGPGGEQTVLTADARGLVTFVETHAVGHYRAAGGRRQGSDVFAVNVDAAEGDTTPSWTADTTARPDALRPVASWEPRWHLLVLIAAMLLALEGAIRLQRRRRP